MKSLDDTSIYEGKIDLWVRNNSHTIAYNLIADAFPERRARILEVGCNTGYFGEVLKRSGHLVFGVESSARAAAVAESRLDHVFVGTIEEFLDAPAYRQERFDCVTFGDVLEHLPDPGMVLKEFGQRLAPRGFVIVSVPNVAHLAVRVMLLGGKWEYSDRGILDRTHLRFFDKRGLVELFTLSGFRVESIAAVRLPVQSAGVPYDPALLSIVAPHVTDDAADVFQYVVQARPGQPNACFIGGPTVRVLSLSPVADWPLGEIRLSNPLTAWAQKYGGELRSRWIGNFSVSDIDWADVIVLQRECNPQVLRLIRNIRRRGKAVIFDIDDLLTNVPSFLIAHEHHQRHKSSLEAILRSVDMVTTTTRRLADHLAQYSQRIAVVPNCPSPPGDSARHYADDAEPVTIFISASDTVQLEFITPVLRRLTADGDLRLRIVAIGPPGEFLAKVGIPVVRHEKLSYQSFQKLIASHNNAIGALPLDASTFSSCKSAIKFLDYSICGVASVCSNVPPYSDVVHNGVTGMLIDNNETAWYQAVRWLVLNPEERRRMAEAAGTLCRQCYLLTHAADVWQTAIIEARGHADHNCDEGSSAWNPMLKVWYWIQLLLTPTAYKSAIRVLWNEGWSGVKQRIKRPRLYF